MHLPRTASRVGLAAGLVTATMGVALVTGLGPAPALSEVSSHRQQDDSSTTSTTAATLPAAAPGAGTRVVDAAGAGTVTVSDAGGQLALVSAVPADGWSVEVEQPAGREVEVDFRRGTQRVQVDVELEDGAVRERVRVRDDATGTDVRIEDGVVVRVDGAAGDTGDHRGSGALATDDRGHDATDDHGGDTGTSGSGRGGADDPPGDDHGAG